MIATFAVSPEATSRKRVLMGFVVVVADLSNFNSATSKPFRRSSR